MLVHKNGSNLSQTPPRRKSQFSNSQTERAVVQAQTRTRQLRSLGSEARKENSILINHSSEPLPLINTCSSLHLMISLILQEKLFSHSFGGLFLSISRGIKPAHMFTFQRACSWRSFWMHARLIGCHIIPALCVVSVTVLLCCCDNTSC